MPRHPHIPARHTPEDVAPHGFRVNPDVDRNDRDPAIAEAVQAAQTGDEEALRFLYLRYKDNIYGYVHSILRDEDEAQDVTQQVFLKLISVIHRYEPRSVPFTAWLIRVARNAALDHQRQRRAIPCEEVFESSRPTDDAEIDRRRGLESALSTLPDDQRNVVVLRHLVGLTPGEIADQMGRSEASIHGLHHRARLSLRRELEGVGCAPTTRLAA